MKQMMLVLLLGGLLIFAGCISSQSPKVSDSQYKNYVYELATYSHSLIPNGNLEFDRSIFKTNEFGQSFEIVDPVNGSNAYMLSIFPTCCQTNTAADYLLRQAAQYSPNSCPELRVITNKPVCYEEHGEGYDNHYTYRYTFSCKDMGEISVYLTGDKTIIDGMNIRILYGLLDYCG